MSEFEACDVFKIKEFTFVNDCFKDKHNEEIGYYGQALFNLAAKINNLLEWGKNWGFYKNIPGLSAAFIIILTDQTMASFCILANIKIHMH